MTASRSSLRRMIAIVALGASLALCLAAQEKDGVTIELDPGIRSDTVQVYPLLVGEFGSFTDYADSVQRSAREIFLSARRKGQRAILLKVVVYAKGCEFALFTMDPLPAGSSRIRYECRKLRSIPLRGLVTGIAVPAQLTVQLHYVAAWSHAYFGFRDGNVLTIPIAEAMTDQDGRFAIDVPDFANDGVTNSYKGKAEWAFIALKPGASDRYWLNPEDNHAASPRGLAFEPKYPAEVRFVAHVSTAPRPLVPGAQALLAEAAPLVAGVRAAMMGEVAGISVLVAKLAQDAEQNAEEAAQMGHGIRYPLPEAGSRRTALRCCATRVCRRAGGSRPAASR